MTSKHWLSLLCLLAGIPLAAWGLASGMLLVGLAGIGLVFVFVAMVFQWIAGASRPMGAAGAIKPSTNPAWSMKDEPVRQTETNR